MSETLTRSESSTPELRPPVIAGVVIAAVVVAALLWAVVTPALSGPDRVSLTVENPTDYAVTVVVVDDGGTSIGLGVVPDNDARQFLEVIDQGEVWTIRFTYEGVEGGVIDMTRAELEAADWTVRIPEAVAAELESAGLEPELDE